MVDLADLAQLPAISKFIERCTVTVIPAGALPKDVTIQLPDADGAKVPARYTGFPPNLAVSDEVSVRATPQDTIKYIISGSSGATAKSGGWPFATIRTVSTTDPDADHPTVEAAVAAAVAGDTILLDSEEFTLAATLIIDKSLTLAGISPEDTTITYGGAGYTITITAADVTLVGLTITNTSTTNIVATVSSNQNNTTLRNCVIGRSGTISGGGSAVSYALWASGGTGCQVDNCRIDNTSVAAAGEYVFFISSTAVTCEVISSWFNGVSSEGAFFVKNVVTAAPGTETFFGDIGYLNEAGEYDETTTEGDNVAWCIALTDGVTNVQTLVKRRGNAIVNYAGGSPNAGEFLITSTTAGTALVSVTMRPEIFAVCTAGGVGGAAGQVAVQLLTGTATRMLTNANDVVRVFTSSDTDFTATINGAPVGAAVAYTLVSGSGDTINVLSTSQVGKIVLHNTVGGRTPTALISDTAPPVITLTANAPGDWVHGDTIQARSTTVTGALPSFPTIFLYDLDLSGFLPELVRNISFTIGHADSAPGANFFSMVHEFQGSPSFSVGDLVSGALAGVNAVKLSPVAIFNKTVCFAVSASGVATSGILLRIRSIDVAVP